MTPSSPAPADPADDRRRGFPGWIWAVYAALFGLSVPWYLPADGPLRIWFGLFLLAKSTYEIHESLEGDEGHRSRRKAVTFASVILQILVLDVVFSLDSVITAVGMVDRIGVMIAAIVIAVVIMLLSAEAISAFVNERPTVKILALSFLLLVGFSLVAEGFHQEIPKGYLYFAMAFSVFVELINNRIRHVTPVRLKKPITP